MKLTYRDAARSDLEDIFSWIEHDGAEPARRVVRRIVDSIEQVLFTYPLSGRLTSRLGVRQWTVPRTPYVVLYRVHVSPDVLEVLSIVHGARDR